MRQQSANADAGNLAQIIHSGVARNARRASGAWRQNGGTARACTLALQLPSVTTIGLHGTALRGNFPVGYQNSATSPNLGFYAAR
jgi:hypothetical protein